MSAALQPGQPRVAQSSKSDEGPGAATIALTDEVPPTTRPMGMAISRPCRPRWGTVRCGHDQCGRRRSPASGGANAQAG